MKPYFSEAERRATLPTFLNYYNHERPHSALGGKPPSSQVPDDSFRLTAEPIDVPVPEEDQMTCSVPTFCQPRWDTTSS